MAINKRTGPGVAFNFSVVYSSYAPGGFHACSYTVTTPIGPALKKLLCITCMQGFLKVQTDILNHFWIQVAVVVSEVKRRLQSRYKFVMVIYNGHSSTPTKKAPLGCSGSATAIPQRTQVLVRWGRSFPGRLFTVNQ